MSQPFITFSLYWLYLTFIISTLQLHSQMISQQGGLCRLEQQAFGLKVGVCEVFRLK